MKDSIKEEKVARTNAVRFGLSLILAILSIAMLSMISCTKENDLEVDEDTTPCIVSSNSFDFVSCSITASPVCGCDGVTYRNACEAVYYNGVTNYTNGACEIAENCINTDSTYTTRDTVYAPVCGCDGKTYTNENEALASGVTSFYAGACGTIEVEICAQLPQRIGVNKVEGRIYSWSEPSLVSCANCAVTITTITDTTLMYLAEYENEKTDKPVKIYPFNLIPVDCLR